MSAKSCICRIIASSACGVLLIGCARLGASEGLDIKPVAIDKAGNPALDMPAIPKDAQYTIVCRSFSGDTHVQDARQAQMQLHDATNLKKWYVVHSGDHSTLYYGFYRCIDPRDKTDGAEGQRALDDQNTIRALSTSDGQRLFSECMLIGIDSPDPEANPAWDITRTKGTWSIEIASCTGASRKQNAVDAVRAARAQGVEAYYYHGDTASSVCIGCWPAESAMEITPDRLNPNPDLPLIVTDTKLAPAFEKSLQAKGLNTAAPEVVIQDPTLTDALYKWKDHATDGGTRPNEKSFLFRIPHKDPLNATTGDDAVVTAPPLAAPTGKPFAIPGDGELRSLGN